MGGVTTCMYMYTCTFMFVLVTDPLCGCMQSPIFYVLYRWDLQRARTILEHQELLKKYNKKSGAAEPVTEKKKEKIVSFLSKLEDGRPGIERLSVLL